MGPKATALKNLIGIWISFTSVFGPFVGILTLQSSINNEQGLGLAGASISYFFKGVVILLTPVLYSLFGSKYSLVIGYTCAVVYALCNFYPSWYTLVPGSMIVGLGLNFMFVNAITHTSETATQYATAVGISNEHTIAFFVAIFSSAIKGGNILGSLVSSSVLFNLDYNESLVPASNESCNDVGASFVEQNYLYYLLIGIYVILSLLGIVVALATLDNFKGDANFKSFSACFNEQIKDVIVKLFNLFAGYKMLLIFPLFVVNGVSIGFISGTFAKVFVSDCVGVQWIGLSFTVYSIVGIFTGILFGWLRRVLPALIMIIVGVVISESWNLFLLLWPRAPNFYAVFGFAIGWGLCDGVWQTIVPGLVGFVFSNAKNSAFTIYEFGVSVGFVITFVSGIVFTPFTHILIIFCIILYSGISYTVLVIIMKCRGDYPSDSVEEEPSTSVRDTTANIEMTKYIKNADDDDDDSLDYSKSMEMTQTTVANGSQLGSSYRNTTGPAITDETVNSSIKETTV